MADYCHEHKDRPAFTYRRDGRPICYECYLEIGRAFHDGPARDRRDQSDPGAFWRKWGQRKGKK